LSIKEKIPVQKDTFQIGVLRNDFFNKLRNLVQFANIENLRRYFSLILLCKLI
jgi:hypothetical protein